MEKLALSLLHMTQRLRRYFEAHPVKVITDQPIKQILSKVEASGKLAKYVMELGAYNITFEPRNAVKGHVLADFISKTPNDGASSLKGFRARLVLIDPSGIEYTYALHLTFFSTNNEAEYEALLADLRIARRMKVQSLKAKVDFKLVASQINGSYIASNDSMMKYLAKAKEYIAYDPDHQVFGGRDMAERKERGTMFEGENSSICNGRGSAFQEIILDAHVKMRWSDTGKLCHPRDTYGSLQNASRTMIYGGKGDDTGILLDHYAQRHKGIDSKM
ncbi:reverse transcriptase domain-containing protein [Tanacetum coccineum]